MPATMPLTWFRERRVLVALCVGLPLAEMWVVGACGIPSGLPLAGQAGAVGPLGVFHDLRWLFVFHDSVLWFLLGLGALVAGRSVVLALLVRSAWPGDPPPFGVLVRRALVVTPVAALLLSPWVTLLFGAAVIPLSWLYFAAVPPALGTVLLLSHGGIDGSWWRRLPPVRVAGWTALSFVVLSLSALGVDGRPPGVAAATLAATGLFNAWAWDRIVRVVVVWTPQRSRRLVPVTVLSVLAVFAAVWGGSRLGFATLSYQDPGAWERGGVEAGTRAVLLVGGFASGCCDEGPLVRGDEPGLYVEQFSYRVLTSGGIPVPHPGSATDADLARMADLVAAQVDGLARRSGLPVAVVAESEGTLVVTAYLARYPEAPVDRMMLLSPIVAPGRVSYPGPGREGLGVVAGYELRAVSALIDSMAPFVVSADGPLTDSVRRLAASLRAEARRDRPFVEEVAVVPLADAVTAPFDEGLSVEMIVVPGFHGGLRGRADIRDMIHRWVRGEDIRGSGVWLTVGRLISGGASAWRVPGLEGTAPGGY